MKLTQALKDHCVSKGWVASASAPDSEFTAAVASRLKAGEIRGSDLAKLTATKSVGTPANTDNGGHGAKRPTPAKAFHQAGGDGASHDLNVRVKSAAEQYEDTRKGLTYPDRTPTGRKHFFAGRPVTHGHRTINEPSDLDKAISGAWIKCMVWKNSERKLLTPNWKPSEHEMDLIHYALERKQWEGPLGYCATEMQELGNDGNDDRPVVKGVLNADQKGMMVKMLLDDSTSGGIDIVPQAFDDAVILYPLLYGELYPFVEIVPVTRGRRITGGIMQNPTFTWGTAEGTSITPFSTINFVSTFNNTVYPSVSAIQIGLDFSEDSPVQVAQVLTQQFGKAAQATLDTVIATGDGATQPTGIFTAAGTTSISTDNNVNGPPTVSDYEALMFGVPKQYRFEAGARGVFLGNETSYQRARGIQVAQSDQRRVFGLNEQDYSLLGNPYKINASIGNSSIAYAMLNRYRLYKRLGLLVRIETAGYTLALTNTKLLVCRMRYGGAPTTGAAFAITTTAQS